MRRRFLRICFLTLAASLALLAGGCATQRPVVTLPYAMPALGTAPAKAAVNRTAQIGTVTDTREDRSLDMFLSEPPVDFLRKALAAELVAGGAFAQVGTASGETPNPSLVVTLELRELSWAVPNHAGMVKTAFWTSFLTGGIGGIAYGSTDTPVFGRAVVAVKLTEPGTGRIVLDQAFDALHEEHTIKLKCDSLETRARVMAAALKAVLVKTTQALASSSPATPKS